MHLTPVGGEDEGTLVNPQENDVGGTKEKQLSWGVFKEMVNEKDVKLPQVHSCF